MAKMVKLQTGGDSISGFWRPEPGDSIKFVLHKLVPDRTGKQKGFFLAELIEGCDKIYTKDEESDELINVSDCSAGEVVGINFWHALEQLPDLLGHEIHLTFKGKVAQKNGRSLMAFEGEFSDEPVLKMLKLSVNESEAELMQNLANEVQKPARRR